MNTVDEFELELPFKGKRDYLHGTDIYQALIDIYNEKFAGQELSDVRLIFKGISRSKLKVVETLPENKDSSAVFTVKAGGKSLRVHLVETGGEVLDRVAYQEHIIAESSAIDEEARKVVVEQSEDLREFNLIEVIVAINKAMHLKVFSEFPGNWFFTEVKTSKPLVANDWKRIEISIGRCLGTRLTRSQIEIDGADAGYICFSLQAPPE